MLQIGFLAVSSVVFWKNLKRLNFSENWNINKSLSKNFNGEWLHCPLYSIQVHIPYNNTCANKQLCKCGTFCYMMFNLVPYIYNRFDELPSSKWHVNSQIGCTFWYYARLRTMYWFSSASPGKTHFTHHSIEKLCLVRTDINFSRKSTFFKCLQTESLAMR